MSNGTISHYLGKEIYNNDSSFATPRKGIITDIIVDEYTQKEFAIVLWDNDYIIKSNGIRRYKPVSSLQLSLLDTQQYEVVWN